MYRLPVTGVPDTIGAVELTSIARGYLITDLMVKRASIEVLDAQAVCPGKFLTIVAGDLAAVEEAITVARDNAESAHFGDLFIPNLAPEIIPAINREVTGAVGETVAIVESFSAVASIDAADHAVKSADVRVESVNLLNGIGGKAFVVVSGALPDVEAAVAAARVRIPRGMEAAVAIIPRCSADVIALLPGRAGG